VDRAGAVFRVARHIDESLDQVRRARSDGKEPEYLRYPYYKRLFAEAHERRLQDQKPWTPNGYYQAVRAACDRAGCPRWTPNQLRHLYATNMRKSVGLDRAATMLGHSKVETTQIYAEIKLQELIETAANHG
jgi:site-specific recombinase XerD